MKALIGYSSVTPIKQEYLKNFLRFHTLITSRVMCRNNKPYYYYFDINAGSGIVNGEQGSPLIFLEACQEYLDKIKATFVEIHPGNFNILTELVEKYRSESLEITCICGNNEEVLQNQLSTFNGGKYGLLYHDPNGIFSVGLMNAFANQWPQLDLLINVNSVAIKRSEKNYGSDYGFESLDIMLSKIAKKYWLIREAHGKAQWTFLFGCNWANFPELQKEGFYALNSRKGKEIFEMVAYTKEEIQKKYEVFPSLFNLGWETYQDYLSSEEWKRIRNQKMWKSNFKCEICHQPSTEIHHRIYSDWRKGEVDKLENLITICHCCHCKIEEKNFDNDGKKRCNKCTERNKNGNKNIN